MTDNPYELDFFQRITDVHWGGPWMVIYGIADAGANNDFPTDATITFSFPGMAGGTPGFTIISGDRPLTSLRAPHAITTKDLQGKLRTDAGLGLTGFSIGASTSGQGVTQPEAAYFLDLSKFPKTKFPVRGTCTSNNSETSLAICRVLLYKQAPKAGLVIGRPLTTPGSSGIILDLPPSDADYESSNIPNGGFGSLTTDFVVDPVGITVTGTP